MTHARIHYCTAGILAIALTIALALSATAAPASARSFNYNSTGSMVQQPPPTGVAFSHGARTRSLAAAGAGDRYGDTPTLSTVSVPPILPTVKASQLARFEQAERQAAAYAPPNGRVYSDAETMHTRPSRSQASWQWRRPRLALIGATRASAPLRASRSRSWAWAQRL